MSNSIPAFPLSEGNQAFRDGHYEAAIRHYLQALHKTPALGRVIAANLAVTRQKYRAGRATAPRPRIAVCGWDSAQRLDALAGMHAHFAEVAIVGDYPAGKNTSPYAVCRLQLANEADCVGQALRLVAQYPCDTVHLAGPAVVNLVVGFLYKLVWGAKIILDINGDNGHLSGLAGEFDGITVSSRALQARYGGKIIGWANTQGLQRYIATRVAREPAAMPGLARLLQTPALAAPSAVDALLGSDPPAPPSLPEPPPAPKTAVAAHVYHPELWPEIAAKLRAIRHPFDLFVTTCQARAAEVVGPVLQDFPEARITIGPNLGMDIVPFLALVPTLANENYLAVCKLHTKKGNVDFADPWRGLMLDALLGDSATFAAVVRAFAEDPALDLVGPAALYLSAQKLMYENEPGLKRLLGRLGDDALLDSDWGFFAGTMFWARPAALTELAGHITYATPDLEPSYQQDGKLEHAVERCFGLVPVLRQTRVGLLQACLPRGGHHALRIAAAGQGIGQGRVDAIAGQYATLREDAQLLRDSGLFDDAHYLAQSPELLGQWVDPITHYLLQGRFLGRWPHPVFDPVAYRAGLDDGETDDTDPLVHYLRRGLPAGVRPPQPAGQTAEASASFHRRALNATLIDWRQQATKTRLAQLVSIVVPALGQAANLPACLEALYRHTPAERFELIVVDNSHDPATREALAALPAAHPGLILVPGAGLDNPALARNLGFAASHGAWLVFLDQNATVVPGWLDPLLASLADHRVAAVQPRLLDPDGRLLGVGLVFSQENKLGYPLYAGLGPEQCQADHDRRFQAVGGACLALRAADFAGVRGFDPRFIGRQADADLCLRLTEATDRYCGYAAAATVIQQNGGTSDGHAAADGPVFLRRWTWRVRLDSAAHGTGGGLEAGEHGPPDRAAAADYPDAPPDATVGGGMDAVQYFDAGWYAAQNPDLPGAAPGWADYLTHGKAEDRKARYFDAEWYLAQNPDLAVRPAAAWSHYLAYGEAEGRPARFFDAQWYARHTPDARKPGVDPWRHYVERGKPQGRLARFTPTQAREALDPALSQCATASLAGFLENGGQPGGNRALAMRLFDQLRSDVLAFVARIGGRDIGGRDIGVLVWWALYGRRELPNVGLLMIERWGLLFAPLPGIAEPSGFGITPLLQGILTERQDLRRAFDMTETGVLDLNAWFYTHGIRAYDLADLVDPETLARLDACPPRFAALAAETRPTWLMFLVWRSHPDLRRKFDLHDPAGLARFIGWFFVQGLADTAGFALAAGRWKTWLREEVPAGANGAARICRAARLLWEQRADLQEAFDLATDAGARGLSAWCAERAATVPLLAWLVPDAPPSRESGPIAPIASFGVNLVGFAFGELGIGEDVRMAAEACEAAGIPYAVVNIDPGATRQQDRLLAAQVTPESEQAPYPISLYCLPGFDTVRAYLAKGEALFAGRYNIGWWPWELPVWPARWACVFELVDEIWAATQFTQEMYRQATDKPVLPMSQAVSVARVLQVQRAEFGIPEDKFAFLYVFDSNSYFERKNPKAAVEAFTQAFDPDDDTVCLVLKTMNARPDDPYWRHFTALCQRDRRILLIERTLERGKVLGLIRACDAYLSLHRAEGFGRTLAEAMLFGKPVVATDYSGNRDFLDARTGFPVACAQVAVKAGEYPFVESADGAVWAQPDLAHAAQQMRAARAAVGDGGFHARIGAYARQQFDPGRVGAAMKDRLEQVFSELRQNKTVGDAHGAD